MAMISSGQILQRGEKKSKEHAVRKTYLVTYFWINKKEGDIGNQTRKYKKIILCGVEEMAQQVRLTLQTTDTCSISVIPYGHLSIAKSNSWMYSQG